MNSLHAFYRNSLKTVTVFIAAATLYFAHTIEPFLKQLIGYGSVPIYVAKTLSSTIVIGGLFLIAEHVIRTWAWRIFHPRLDFEGMWVGVSTYQQMVIPSDNISTQTFRVFHAVHPVEIAQDCTTISIENKDSTDYVQWHSLACDLTATSVFQYAYYVSYKDSKSGELIGYKNGYEQMSVSQWHPRYKINRLFGLSILKIPICLTGNFAHCVDGNPPLYRGSTLFIRLNNIKDALIPDEDRKLIMNAIDTQPILKQYVHRN